MATLVVGASGATGKLLVEQLLKSGERVKVIVRSTSNIPEAWYHNDQLVLIREHVTRIDVDGMAKHLAGCKAVASCLGHSLTWKGIYGKPRRLVTDTVRLISDAILKSTPETRLKFVLMNTAGNSNNDLKEPISFGQKMVTGLLRILLPPHADNEQAADYLRVHIGKEHPYMEWVVVRPDTLIDQGEVSGYSLHRSPIRSALFNPGKTSRINVGHFMAELLTDEKTWDTWKGQMPVIYNEAD